MASPVLKLSRVNPGGGSGAVPASVLLLFLHCVSTVGPQGAPLSAVPQEAWLGGNWRAETEVQINFLCKEFEE